MCYFLIKLTPLDKQRGYGYYFLMKFENHFKQHVVPKNAYLENNNTLNVTIWVLF